MAMEKQTRLIVERLAAIEAKLEKLTGGQVFAELEAGEVDWDSPQLAAIETKLDQLIALLSQGPQAEGKPAKKPGIGENKS